MLLDRNHSAQNNTDYLPISITTLLDSQQLNNNSCFRNNDYNKDKYNVDDNDLQGIVATTITNKLTLPKGSHQIMH